MTTTRFDPFARVSARYGAPMGRPGKDFVDPDFGRLCARHQGGSDGYDKGGAYWGLPHNVWAVWIAGQGPETVSYVRANSRLDAIAKAMNLPGSAYALQRGWFGRESPTWCVTHYGTPIQGTFTDADSPTDALMLFWELRDAGRLAA